MSTIYDRPDAYDLEHAGPQRDVAFFREFLQRRRPRRILEYACGNGRLTLPLAAAAAEWGGHVTGVDASETMLAQARSLPNPDGIAWAHGDVRTWRPDEPVDLVLSGCSSLSHLLEFEDHVATWRNAAASLRPGGRFLVAEVAPDFATLAESMRVPPRPVMQLDGDFEADDERLLRCRTATYRADRQLLRVRFLYDRFERETPTDRFVDDYDAHVFFPAELRLLFHFAGFVVESEWGGYDAAPLRHTSRVMILCGRLGSSENGESADPGTGAPA